MSAITFSLNDYPIPQWSPLPQYKCHFQVIKNGSFVDNVNIRNKSFHLIGRLDDLCDIFVDNPTVSRKHAILQFKFQDPYPYLYDLGGTHGTQVNHNKLPPRVYQKIAPFDIIKFGVSSKMYVYRCPELQQKLQEQDDEGVGQKNFMQTINQNKKKLSQSQLKQKYLQMLQNDPCFAANSQAHSGKFMGNKMTDDYDQGINWGINDEYEVYAYKNQHQFQIEPDIIRRLPGLDQMQLNRLAEYETNMRKYEQVERSLNQLRNKERKEYGLEQTLQDKKEKLQKRFVQALEAVQKCQQWIRNNIFGEQTNKKHQKHKKYKDTDTFEDDQFLDRTLAAKRQKKQAENRKLKQQQKQMVTSQDYWKLDKDYRNLIKELIQIEQEQNQNSNKLETIQEEQDELDEFMKQNQDQLVVENKELWNNKKNVIYEQMEEIKSQLIKIIGQTQIKAIEDEQRGIKPKKIVSQEKKRKLKEEENRKKMDKVLGQLDQMRKRAAQLDEEDLRIFDVYREEAELQEQLQNQKYMADKRARSQDVSAEMKQYEQPIMKGPKWKVNRDLEAEQDYTDLTKTFK